MAPTMKRLQRVQDCKQTQKKFDGKKPTCEYILHTRMNRKETVETVEGKKNQGRRETNRGLRKKKA
jgi:hypothetical protein